MAQNTGLFPWYHPAQSINFSTASSKKITTSKTILLRFLTNRISVGTDEHYSYKMICCSPTIWESNLQFLLRSPLSINCHLRLTVNVRKVIRGYFGFGWQLHPNPKFLFFLLLSFNIYTLCQSRPTCETQDKFRKAFDAKTGTDLYKWISGLLRRGMCWITGLITGCTMWKHQSLAV